MHQFFVGDVRLEDGCITLDGSDWNHIKNVLRMKPGEELAVIGADGREYRCLLERYAEGKAVCRLIFIREEGVELPVRVTLFQGLPKGDKMDSIVQKMVELGVWRLVPVATGRSVVRMDEKKAQLRRERWQAIAKAASMQSRRRIVPRVEDVTDLDGAMALAGDVDVKLIPYEMARGMGDTRRLIEGISRGQEVALLIGPEGGFSPEEVALAQSNGFVPMTLGKRILRTETAGLAVMSWIMYHLEED